MNFYKKILSETLNKEADIVSATPVSGGCISNAQKIITKSEEVYFIKTNSFQMEHMFLTEATGLGTLRNNGFKETPTVIRHGVFDDKAFILMEYLEGVRRVDNYFEDFGERLAELHACTQKEYGFEIDNYIGALPQKNTLHTNWVDFFVEERLRFQIKLDSSLPLSVIDLFERFYPKLPELLPDYSPSLLHGDLWSGNFMTGPDGKAWLIDPAIYYGNREIELAFTKMFGGFDNEFYTSYNSVFPLESGFEDRVDIYNLYPLLVHHNLFGGGYLSSAINIVQRYV